MDKHTRHDMLCHERTRVAGNISMQSVNESFKVNNKVSGNIVNLARQFRVIKRASVLHLVAQVEEKVS